MRKHLSIVIFAFSSLMLFSSAMPAQSRASVSAAEVNGTFRMNFSGKFKEFSNDVKVLALGGGKIRFALDLIYPYSTRSGEPMANLGTLDEEASITGDTAIFNSEDGKCKLTLLFVKAGTLKITQEGSDADCGFGHNVMASGTYKKVSSKKPKFEEN